MKGLTKRQLEVAQFIENYIDENGFAPSIRNVADHFGFSPKAAYDHMTALKKKSIIKTVDNLPRSLCVVKKTTGSDYSFVKVPVLGTTAAGKPINTYENYDGYVPVPTGLLGTSAGSDELYALRVRGDSMIEDGINDGDLAILLRTKVANNGDIVAACIGEEESYAITLKHFYRNADRYELRPANSAYRSIVSTHCDIQGKLLMIIRNY